jgi:deoxyribose-phosphate aldolase
MARLIDQAILRAGVTRDEIRAACEEATLRRFRALCVSPSWIQTAAGALEGSDTAACAAVGFPLGAHRREVKVLEARRALDDGAKEIDMVIDVGALRSGDPGVVRKEVAAIAEACREGKAVLKVIIETAVLTDDEKVQACQICREEAANFVKTSTGFGPGGATVGDVKLLASKVAPFLGVKASGGIRTAEFAMELVEAGATRIGTSSGREILKEMGS